LDDSLKTVKKKLILEMGKTTTAYDEIYLFSQIQQHVTSHDIFKYHSETTGSIDPHSMQQLAVHLQLDPNEVPHKPQYTFADVVELGIDTRPSEIFVPLGMRFANTHDHFFPAYPYSASSTTNTLYDQNPQNPLLLLDESLLLNYVGSDTPGFKYNVLYVCMAEDILEFAKSRKVATELAVLNTYFPLLANVPITDRQELIQTRKSRTDINGRILNPQITTLYDKHAMFHQIWRGTRGQESAATATSPEYEDRGIGSIWITIHPEVKHIIPLDVLFRNMHATKYTPMIKYNPGLRYDNLFRFYYESVSPANMIKIPYLTKPEIMRLLERMGSKKQLLTMVVFEEGFDSVLVDIFPNGNISVRAEFAKPVGLDIVDRLVIQMYSNTASIINRILQESGYSLNPIANIRDRRRVEIVDVGYQTTVVCKKLDFKKHGGCLSAIFNILQVDYQKGIEMRYKRVENYTEMDAENAYILDIYRKTNNETEIIEALKTNLGLTEADARAKIIQVLSENTQIQGGYVNRAVDFVEHPGFPVRVMVETVSEREFRHIITVKNIDHIEYLPLLELYIDGFVRINQDPKTCGTMKKTDIQTLCKTGAKPVKDEIHIERVVVGVGASAAIPNIQLVLEDPDADLDRALLEGDPSENEDDDYEDAILFDDYDMHEGESDRTSDRTSDSNRRSNKPENTESATPPTPISFQNNPVGQSVTNALTRSMEKAFESSRNSSKGSNEFKGSSESFVIHGNIDTSSSGSNQILFDDYEEQDRSDTGSSRGGKSPSSRSSRGSSSTPDNKNIDGLPLNESNNNYFLKRLKTREPTLFISKPQGKFKSYSRLCPSQFQRQPVILNKREYDRLKEYDQENHTQALKYNDNYYICPRYWCLKTNSSITQADVDAGKCGTIIPKNADKVPPGAYVYEFNHPEQHHSSIDTKAKITNSDNKKDTVVVVKKGEYFKNNPGFLSPESSPDGKCMPCCFRKLWNSEFLVKQLDQCGIRDDPRVDQPANSPVGHKAKPAAATADNAPAPPKRDKYISAIERFPLPEKRFGFLPISIQTFFGFSYKSAITAGNTAELKKNQPVLLRYGTESSNLFSFVSALCDPYAFEHKLRKIPTVKQMQSILAKAVSLDEFIRIHNGSLPAIFNPSKNSVEFVQGPDISNKEIDYNNPLYTESEFYKSIDLHNPLQEDFLYTTIAAYEQFQYFLTKTETAKIDHEYLWDIVSQPNPKLFSKGLNLALLEIANNDITDNVEMVCPTPAYSNYLYDPRKQTLVLLKRETDNDANYPIYEPIYLYEDRTGEPDLHITRTFRPNTEIKNIERVLTIIQEASRTKCKPQPSFPRQILPFKSNSPVKSVIELLVKHGIPPPIQQVANYQRKIIGIMVPTSPAAPVFLPTAPSPHVPNLPLIYMDDDHIWRDYRATTKFLWDIHTKTNGEIASKPLKRITEDGLVVGILTETNQFVKIDPPEENTLYDDQLQTIEGEDTILADQYLTHRTSTPTVTNRAFITKCIQLETQMYSAFRSYIRILINTVENKSYRDRIVQVLQMSSNGDIPYSKQLDQLIPILIDLVGPKIKFVEFDRDVIRTTDHVFIHPAKQDVIYLSRYHLISKYIGEINKRRINPDKIKNKRIYFTRLADELVRYQNIQKFMLSAQNYTNVSNTEYQIRPDEFILPNSVLTGNYFDEIEYTRRSPYIQNTAYDNARPQSKEQNYSHDVTVGEQREYLRARADTATTIGSTPPRDIKEDQLFALFTGCQQSEPGEIEGNKRAKWRVRFERSYRDAREWKFKNTIQCSFSVVLYILYEYKHRVATIQELKSALVKQYKHYMTKFKKAIYHILERQGKKDVIKQVRKGVYTIETAIMSDAYYITDLDTWMLAEEFDLPIVLFCTKGMGIINMITTTNYRELDWIMLDRNYKKKDRFYFVKSDTTKIDIPRSSVIIPCMTFEELGEDMGGWMRDSADMANFDSLAAFFERYET
jgi:hypothetical protein